MWISASALGMTSLISIWLFMLAIGIGVIGLIKPLLSTREPGKPTWREALVLGVVSLLFTVSLDESAITGIKETVSGNRDIASKIAMLSPVAWRGLTALLITATMMLPSFSQARVSGETRNKGIAGLIFGALLLVSALLAVLKDRALLASGLVPAGILVTACGIRKIGSTSPPRREGLTQRGDVLLPGIALIVTGWLVLTAGLSGSVGRLAQPVSYVVGILLMLRGSLRAISGTKLITTSQDLCQAKGSATRD